MNYKNYFYSPFDFYKDELNLRKEENFFQQILSLRSIISGGFLIREVDFENLEKALTEIKEELKKKFNVSSFSIKASNFDEKERLKIKKVISKFKGEFLVRLIREEKIKIVFDLVGKKDLSVKFYLLKKPKINPVLASNVYLFLNRLGLLKKIEKVAFIDCEGVFPTEFIYMENLVKGALMRKDLDIFKLFEIKPIEEFPNLKTNKQYFCLGNSSLDVDLARKTARIAKTEDLINFSRTDLFWIDWKFGEKELDLLVANLKNEKEIEDFFYQSSYVAKYSLVVFEKELHNKVIEWAKKYNLKEKSFIETKKIRVSLFF